MENIWAFLLQTLTVSMVAALILFLKWLFQDKLSPRWQYGVWIILLLRMILPKQMDRALFFNLPVWVETIKAMVEQNLQSAYTDAFIPLSMYHFVPFIQTAPVSITDWLFVLYVAGIVGMLFWYVASYVRLRLLLCKGQDISVEQRQTIAHVCSKYDLTACKTVAVPGLPSAFVCGIIRPVLALPANTSVDEKIILHELLHLQHRDALRNVGWSFLRAFHWCNPFMQMVFRRIGNDIESLCDQRVLERLEGEERREYGNILLSMANRQYARAPGTTSISNGGKNISRRIAAIVRFKKYPQGMALVSVCIVLVLAVPAMAGTEITYSQNDYEPKQLHELDKAMALARINRCTTVTGALDTYAKGLLLENGVYIATVTPDYHHEALYEQMKKANTEDGWAAYHLDNGDELENVTYRDSYFDKTGAPYNIYNLYPHANGTYTATLVFRINTYSDENNIVYQNGCVLIPVTVRESGGWIVQETGDRIVMPEPFDPYGNLDAENEPALRLYTAQGDTGEVQLRIITESKVDNEIVMSSWPFRDTKFDFSIKPNAELSYMRDLYYVRYDSTKKLVDEAPEVFAGYQMNMIWDDSYMPELDYFIPRSSASSSSSGEHSDTRDITEDWNGIVQGGGGRGYYGPEYQFALPQKYQIGIYWDGVLKETIVINEEQYLEVSKANEVKEGWRAW